MIEGEVRCCATENGIRIAYCVSHDARRPPLEDAVRLYEVSWQE